MLCMTVGTFDGVHRGHRYLIEYLNSLGGRSLVVTFSNHPGEILRGEIPKGIVPREETITLLRALVDEVVVLPFTSEVAALSYRDFLASYPIDHLVLGEGSVLGRGRQGTADQLMILGRERGFRVHVVPHLCDEGGTISSTRIRALFAEGKDREAERLLWN